MADGPPIPLKLIIDLFYIFTSMKFHILKGCIYTHGKLVADGRSKIHKYTQ